MRSKPIVFVLLALLCLSFSVKALVIEEWLEPVVEYQTFTGDWVIQATDNIPSPPIKVQDQDKNRVLVKLRRIGLVWIPRTSVRLSEETLDLTCQKSSAVRAGDYQNFGMRGDSDLEIKCLNE
ncbi:hypothetical protein EJ063_00440 [Vibrio aquaticus]|uniref:Uncharacterized protein n=1 Tax=Vibrio aquaticus TaxID=2496559 RepID=A0A432D043_9VIBR|nr:hypothetical protein [Vibrio aquaticus]RTZ17284.1 hypothetical protein EJ063_00440 [Vibrio aquaticus]